ncbi:hypothetical protein CerSpe_242550 [Prunus speciosa]
MALMSLLLLIIFAIKLLLVLVHKYLYMLLMVYPNICNQFSDSHASKLSMEAGFGASSQRPVSIANSIPQNLQPTQSHALKLSTEEEMSLSHSLKSMGFMGNGYVLASEPVAVSVPFQQPVSGSTSGMVFSPTKAPEAMLPFKVDAISSSGAIADGLTVKTSSNLPTGIRKNLVSRPVRHLGPPPGFSSVPPKNVNESIYVSDSMSENLQWTLQLVGWISDAIYNKRKWAQ